MMELIFEVRDAEDGGYWARALGQAIFTEGEIWEELRSNVLEAISLHFEDAQTEKPLHSCRGSVMSLNVWSELPSRASQQADRSRSFYNFLASLTLWSVQA